MKIWLVLLLLLSLPAFGQDDFDPPDELSNPQWTDTLFKWRGDLPEEPEDPNDLPITWVDSGHAFATNKAQALTEWMDAFFGDPNYNIEQAESFLRLEAINEWDEEDGNNFRLRLRGKLQLPKISRRLNLVFSGEEGDDLTEEERREEDRVGLQYRVRQGVRSRFDLTLGWASGNIRPGIRYRNTGNFSDTLNYRYIQRLQWEDGDGFFTTANADLNKKLDSDSIVRWANRLKWGEETDGVEWRTRLALRERRYVDSRRPLALSYFGAINGVTRPENYVRNYRLGVLWRRQIYRDYLFFEIEPAFNYRRRTLEDDREPAWSIILRLEIALERDLRRVR